MTRDCVTLDEAREIVVAAARRRQEIIRDQLQRMSREGRLPEEALTRLTAELEALSQRDIFMAKVYAGQSVRASERDAST